MLRVATDSGVALRATAELRRRLRQAAGRATTRIVGTPGDHGVHRVHRIRAHDIWACWTDLDNRFFNVFGTGWAEYGGLTIVAEMNFPRTHNRRVGGVVVEDERGRLLLCHRGKIGGGRPGVGKEAFWNRFEGDTVRVLDGDVEIDVAVIAPLDSRTLVHEVASFVHQVAAIKAAVVVKSNQDSAAPRLKHGRFLPEFVGRMRYSRTGDVEAVRRHGVVIKALRSALERHGIRAANDRPRDLYVASRRGKLRALFEVKTDLSTTSLHAAVGQLMLHGRSIEPSAKLVLVLPSGLSAATCRGMQSLGIRVLTYSLEAGGCRLPGLSRLLENLRLA